MTLYYVKCERSQRAACNILLILCPQKDFAAPVIKQIDECYSYFSSSRCLSTAYLQSSYFLWQHYKTSKKNIGGSD